MLGNTTKIMITLTACWASGCVGSTLDEKDDNTTRAPCGEEGSVCDDPPDEYPDRPDEDSDGDGGCDGSGGGCGPDLDEVSIDVDVAVLGAGVFVGLGGACALDVAESFSPADEFHLTG
jgi:hypothetical protein